MAQHWGAAVGPLALTAHNPLPKGAKDVLPKHKGDGKLSVEEHLNSFNVATGILAIQYEDVAIRLFVQTLTEGVAEWFSQLQLPTTEYLKLNPKELDKLVKYVKGDSFLESQVHGCMENSDLAAAEGPSSIPYSLANLANPYAFHDTKSRHEVEIPKPEPFYISLLLNGQNLMSYKMLLSRTFCKDLGGEIKMDWYEAIIPLGNQKIKLEPKRKNKYTIFPSDNPKAQILFQECEFGNYLVLAPSDKKTDEAIDGTDGLWTDHFQDLSAVLQHCYEHGISLNPKKSVFSVTEGKLLGHIISQKGVKIDPKRVNAIQRLSLPSSRTGVRSFFGQVNFLRRFVLEFVETTKHIVGLLSEQHPFKWTEEAKDAFEKIKGSIANVPTLVNPDFTKDFILYCYASEHTMSGILLQLDENGAEMPIAFMSTPLKKHELKHSPMEKHAYAVVKAMKQF
ncbi:uncharacterized protein LOC131859180 [Cryptomeria japonica]|uniref:uncharacterized protein LOC131859180 n=1 Tax=Cryptomeria japonica TaxID=3369 RepID=UPI0027DAA693|nr:uncharacterized protein LOC131859180 [Cryptomeria japonica]